MTIQNNRLATAFIFGAGSALASHIFPETVYVKARALNDPTGPVECFNTGKNCDGHGTLACTIEVIVQTGNGIVSSDPMIAFKPYRDIDDCGSVIVWHSNSGKQSSFLNVNRLEAY